jgi:hypothetical protein
MRTWRSGSALLSLGHSNIANNDLQVFFLVGHDGAFVALPLLNIAATPFSALIYEGGCVKLRPVLNGTWRTE